MPKKSVFTPKKKSGGYKRKFSVKKSSTQGNKGIKKVAPNSGIYSAMNKISSILLQLNELKHDIFGNGAPELLKNYVSRSAMELHALHKLLNDKLPDDYVDETEHEHAKYDNATSPRAFDKNTKEVDNSKDSDTKEDKEALSFEDELADIELAIASSTSNNSPKRKLARDLTEMGLIVGVRELSIGRTPRSKQFISLHGSLVKACRELVSYWKVLREQVCLNNKHDPVEYRELRSALSEDLDEAYQFIETLI